MRVATRIEDVRESVERQRRKERTVGLVPTMGALHEGHLSLVRLARERADFVVLSIFVNPTQFGPGEDFESYPRTLEEDERLADGAGVDLVFAPAVREMYAPDASTRVSVSGLSDPLCGAGRPGHFDGVALVVTKLLNVVRPDFSVFGQKDAQQALLIRRLVRDLNLPGEIVIGPTVREPDGLAMSSRNRYLSPEERKAALALSRGLFSAEKAWEEGDRDAAELVDRVRREIESEPRLQAEYVEIRDREKLDPWQSSERPAVLAVAVRVGRARLIDNVFLGGPGDLEPTPEGAGEERIS